MMDSFLKLSGQSSVPPNVWEDTFRRGLPLYLKTSPTNSRVELPFPLNSQFLHIDCAELKNALLSIGGDVTFSNSLNN